MAGPDLAGFCQGSPEGVRRAVASRNLDRARRSGTGLGWVSTRSLAVLAMVIVTTTTVFDSNSLLRHAAVSAFRFDLGQLPHFWFVGVLFVVVLLLVRARRAQDRRYGSDGRGRPRN